MERKCENCGNAKWRDGVTAIEDICIKCKYVDVDGRPQPSNWKSKQKSIADHIRGMCDAELVERIIKITIHDARPWCDFHCRKDGKYGCEKCVWKWLQQPVEDEQ